MTNPYKQLMAKSIKELELTPREVEHLESIIQTHIQDMMESLEDEVYQTFELDYEVDEVAENIDGLIGLKIHEHISSWPELLTTETKGD